MKSVPHPEKLRRSVSRSITSQAITEMATGQRAGIDDLGLYFACQNNAPDEFQILFQQHYNDLAV